MSWVIQGSTERTLAFWPTPPSWISLTLWPRCRSLKSQSRKTPALIRYDGSACRPCSVRKTETHLLGGNKRSHWRTLRTHSGSCQQATWFGRCGAPLILCKSAVQLAPLTFVSIIVLVSPKWLEDCSFRAILVRMYLVLWLPTTTTTTKTSTNRKRIIIWLRCTNLMKILWSVSRLTDLICHILVPFHFPKYESNAFIGGSILLTLSREYWGAWQQTVLINFDVERFL